MRRVWRFRRSERGSLTILGLFLFLMILMAAGIGVDLMRFERQRTLLQSTLDRATLGAADLDQTQDPESVVRSYLEKAGLLENLQSITVTDGVGFREIKAVADLNVPTHFMKLSGVDNLRATIGSVAEESVQGVEVTLVLDISGSMGDASGTAGDTKISLLQNAAKEFVSLMLDKGDQSEISVSIVPYASQVNAGKTLLDQFSKVTQEHSYSHCVNFIPEQFSDSDLHANDKLERAAHFDPFTFSEGSIDTPVCPVRAGSAITLPTNDIVTLNTQIDALSAKGNTSIDVGMKWGVALLDPSMQPIISDLSANGAVPTEFANRPSGYDQNTLKIVVVMTDGENTDQYLLNPSLRSGLSDVWYNAEEGRYSVYQSQGKDKGYFWPDLTYDEGSGYWIDNGEWNDHPYGDDEPGTAVRLTYPELFNRASVYWNAFMNHYFLPNYLGEWYEAAFSKINATAKDQRTKHVCKAAKKQGIIVFGIAFEAPEAGFDLISECASSSSHVYDVSGLEIEKAFVSIASSIHNLRLTQ